MGSTIFFVWFAGDFQGFLWPDPFRVYTEDWSPKRSSVEEARSLNLLLDSPSLARVFQVSRHLATHGDSAYRPSSHPSWGMMLLWAEPTGVRKFCKGPWPGIFPRVRKRPFEAVDVESGRNLWPSG